jgi:hypothetical protein
VLSLAAAGALGTLLVGAIASLPPPGVGESKLSRAFRAFLASRRKTLRRIRETVRTEYRDRTVYVHVPVDPDTGVVLDRPPKVHDPRGPRMAAE